MVASATTKQELHNEYSDVFTGIGCFKATFSLQVKDRAKPYNAPHRHVTYALHEPPRKELKRLQEQQIIVLLQLRQNGFTKYQRQIAQYTNA